MNVLSSITITIASIAFAGPALGSNESKQNAEVSDDGFNTLADALRNINLTLHALPRTATEPGLGAQTLESKNAFDRAEQSFKSNNWSAAINESVIFLNLNQRPDPATSMRAQYILGRSYEARKQYLKATRAYSRYLAIYTTNQALAAPELTDVFERLIMITTTNPSHRSPELSQFLSAVVAIDHPQNLKDELKYLSSVAGAKTGQKNTAIQWLRQIGAGGAGPELQARSKYFKALLAMHEEKWEDAAWDLKSITSLEGLAATNRDNANLALARVQTKLKKPDLALSIYSQIDEPSPAFREARYESIFVLINQQKYRDAKSIAAKSLDQYPDDPQAPQLKMLSAWLDLHTGDLDAAKSSIDATSSHLTAIQKSLKTDFQLQRLTAADGQRLSALTQTHAPLPADLEEILSIFRQLDELKQRLFEVDGIERNIIFSLANGQLGASKPAFANQIIQYENLAADTLRCGTNLVAMHRSRIKDALSQIHIHSLDANEKKRLELFTHYERLRRQSQRWRNWYMSAEQLSRLENDWLRLDNLAAKRSAHSLHPSLTADMVQLNQAISGTQRDILKTLRIIRENQAQNLADQSEIQELIMIVDSFSKLLYQDHLILSSYKPESGNALDSLDNEESKDAWQLWLDTSTLLYANLQKTRDKASVELARLISDLKKIDDTKLSLLREISDLSSVLEEVGGKTLPKILAELEFAISQRISRQLKWAGDLEFIRYMDTTNERERAKTKHALDIQILLDDANANSRRSSK